MSETSKPHSERLNIWAEPLTDNERAIIASIIDGSDESDLVKKWLRHVIKCYDGLFEQLEAHRTFADHFLQWCETVAAEEDNPIHLLVREAEALNPAKSHKERVNDYIDAKIEEARSQGHHALADHLEGISASTQLEALREELRRVADGVVVLREDEIGTWAYALVSSPASSPFPKPRMEWIGDGEAYNQDRSRA